MFVRKVNQFTLNALGIYAIRRYASCACVGLQFRNSKGKICITFAINRTIIRIPINDKCPKNTFNVSRVVCRRNNMNKLIERRNKFVFSSTRNRTCASVSQYNRCLAPSSAQQSRVMDAKIQCAHGYGMDGGNMHNVISPAMPARTCAP